MKNFKEKIIFWLIALLYNNPEDTIIISLTRRGNDKGTLNILEKSPGTQEVDELEIKAFYTIMMNRLFKRKQRQKEAFK